MERDYIPIITNLHPHPISYAPLVVRDSGNDFQLPKNSLISRSFHNRSGKLSQLKIHNNKPCFFYILGQCSLPKQQNQFRAKIILRTIKKISKTAFRL